MRPANLYITKKNQIKNGNKTLLIKILKNEKMKRASKQNCINKKKKACFACYPLERDKELKHGTWTMSIKTLETDIATDMGSCGALDPQSSTKLTCPVGLVRRRGIEEGIVLHALEVAWE